MGSRCISSLVAVKYMRIGSGKVRVRGVGGKKKKNKKREGWGGTVSDCVAGEASRVADEC